ncbi:MAG: HD domain-containing protein [Ruminococcus sp.]|nr:HD domain-containing protein [Ruminococcus sp.]
MDIIIPSNVEIVMKKLEEAGFEAYLVGGCVRDGMLGKQPKDYDIATNALPEETMQCFGRSHKVIETGVKYGTVTVVSGEDSVEVTTYRTDGEYTDRRRPESVRFSSCLEHDLARRDFTVNAMAYSPKKGVIDLFGGQQDLFSRCIRCVGDPCERFEEDALRIMRALRFASVLSFNIDAATARAMHSKRSLLKEIASERISSELTGFITGASPCDLMIEFDDIFTTVIPEFLKCVEFDQRSRYHVYDVWEHIAHAVENSKNDKYVRLALLFHDIEKPSCFFTDDEGQGHFAGHERKSAEAAEAIMRRLRFDNETVRRVCELIKFHYVTPVADKKVVKRLLSALGIEQFVRLTEVVKGDSRAKQSFCLERVGILDSMKYLAYEAVNNGECFSLSSLAVNGDDLGAAGITGREAGDTLGFLLGSVIGGELENEKKALMEAALKYHRSLCGI